MQTFAAPDSGPSTQYFDLLRTAAVGGNVEAMSLFGHWLLEGYSRRGRVLLARSPRQGVRWLRKAAACDVPEALLNLADCLAYGIGTKRNRVEAERCYRRAARLGEHTAAFNLATHFRDRDDRRGERRWLNIAVRLGDDSFAPLVLAEIDLSSRRRDVSARARRYLRRQSRSSYGIGEEAAEILEHFDRTGQRRWGA